MHIPVWHDQLKTILPPGDSSKYNTDINNNHAAEFFLRSRNEDILYYSKRINAGKDLYGKDQYKDLLIASVKMPNNEIQHFEFEFKDVSGNYQPSVTIGDKVKPIQSISDFLERKVFDEKVKIFSEKLGKNTPEAEYFSDDRQFKYMQSYGNSISMNEHPKILTRDDAKWYLSQSDPHTQQPYATGKFVISQPLEPNKKNDYLDVCIKITDQLIVYLSFELKNGEIYLGGKKDNKIDDMSDFIQKYTNKAANLVSQLDKYLEKIEKLEKNIKSSQQLTFNTLKNRAKAIKQDIANGKITNQKDLSTAMDAQLKEPLSQIAKRGHDNNRYKIDVVNKFKNIFRGEATRNANKILREMEKQKTQNEEKSTFRKNK